MASLITAALLLPLILSVAYAKTSDMSLGAADLILPGYVDEKKVLTALERVTEK